MEKTTLEVPEFKILVVLHINKNISPFIANHHTDGDRPSSWEKVIWERQDEMEPYECRLLLNWARSCEAKLCRVFCEEKNDVTFVNFRFSFDSFSNLERFYREFEIGLPQII